jgi:hypothetical protein
MPTSSVQPALSCFSPEENPFQTVVADITHRCNMACRNCYIPNRSIPDMDTSWQLGIMGRLPRGTFIRFIGAGPCPLVPGFCDTC